MSSINENQSTIDGNSSSQHQEGLVSSVSQANDIQQRLTPNTIVPPIRQSYSPWSIVKSFAFRVLMIYLVTR
ncbi:unnamed protein product, partial [Rotaria magnacalcarata]